MKPIYPSLLLVALTSCVSVRFPSEIKVNVTFPENLSEENISQIIDKIPPTLGKRKVNTWVEVTTSKDTTTREKQREESLQNK